MHQQLHALNICRFGEFYLLQSILILEICHNAICNIFAASPVHKDIRDLEEQTYRQRPWQYKCQNV